MAFNKPIRRDFGPDIIPIYLNDGLNIVEKGESMGKIGYVIGRKNKVKNLVNLKAFVKRKSSKGH